jgi:CheY-like chemotaxis protein
VLKAKPGRRGRVLVVDSDPGAREAIVRYLRGAGYSVAQAADGLQALERISHHVPDVVLLDPHLPIMTGERFVEALQRDEVLRSIPIVLLSAAADLSHAAPALGARAALAKPIDMDVLLAVLNRVGRR